VSKLNRTQIIIGIVVFMLFGAAAILIPYLITQRQQADQAVVPTDADQTQAWQTSQSVSAVCAAGNVSLEVRFTNTEPNQPRNSMNVVATDLQTGQSVNMGTIAGGQSATQVISTNRASVSGGQVKFTLTWTDGHSGTDQRTVSYSALNCQNQPTLSCRDIKLYSQTWQPLNANEVIVGQQIYVAVTGTTTEPSGITKARFSFNNGSTWQESTTKNPQSEYYVSWTVPASTLEIQAQVHNPILGWR
jgi:hypothetical protein